MKAVLILPLLVLAAGAHAQLPQTIEGYWQDAAGRTTFKRNNLPGSTYGDWYERDLGVTYPQAKRIRKSASGYELADLNFDEREYSITVLRSDPSRIMFVRKANWSNCRVAHDCRLEGGGLFCAVQTLCQEAGKDVLDWRGEERYVRREHCARDGSVQAQGFPVKCR